MIEKTMEQRIRELGKELGIPEDICTMARPDNWVKLFQGIGAETYDERYRVHDMGRDRGIPELRDLPMIAPGAEIVAISKENNEWHVIAQVRNNGEEKEEDKEIGVPGGAMQMWSYTPYGSKQKNVVIEHPELTAKREWMEETGMEMPYNLSLLTVKRTTNHYAKWPDAYAVSFYYSVEVPWTYIEEMKTSKGSDEGKIQIIKVKDLLKYKWFPDASEAFQFLVDYFT